MSQDHSESLPEPDVSSFSTSDSYVVGAGETLDELQANGQWIKTTDPVDVRQ
jgi:hypothetical protein